MKVFIFVSFALLLIGGPGIYWSWQDYRDIKLIESIQWDITVGGDGLYTSKDGNYKLLVGHPTLPSIGDSGDPDGYLEFRYYGGSNFISHPPKETMQIFAKRQ